MTRTRILVAALAALAFAAPAASADPHAIDAHARAELQKQDLRSADAIDSAVQAELRARGRDAMTDGVAPTTAITRALANEKAYSSYGEPAPLEPTAPQVADDDDGAPWPLIGAGFLGIALLFGAAVALVARPRRARVAA
jgi:hypothetical protein